MVSAGRAADAASETLNSSMTPFLKYLMTFLFFYFPKEMFPAASPEKRIVPELIP